MSPDGSSFTRLNLPNDIPIPRCTDYLTLHAPPNTDLWRKPPCRDTTTCPILYTTLSHPFITASVTISVDWEMEWDQGGLVIFAGSPPTTTPNTVAQTRFAQDAMPPPYHLPPPSPSKWVKASLEFTSGLPHASSVSATADGADLALAPLPRNTKQLQLKLERIGHALWIWYCARPGGDGQPLRWYKFREVTWFFWGVEDKNVRVGVYAARPASFGPTEWELRNPGSGSGSGSSGSTGRGLHVEFEGLQII